ncbi:gallinacin-13-like [Zootoca vivipara]|uniref:gallinacin-13-like n=1 Tax=Zootoca vivipara TaxID=8524 RepID=UPI00293BEE91|nr:gallinacin-13-like [Zootoca vivipara]
MKRSVVLFPLFLLLSIAQAGRRRKTDTQTCILRDGYCRSKCNETTWAIPERDLGTCANGKQRCCRPEELLPSHQEISDGPQL